MVLSVGGAWLTVHLLLLLLLRPPYVSLTSSSASDVTADATAGRERLKGRDVSGRGGGGGGGVSGTVVPEREMVRGEDGDGVRMVADQSGPNSAFEIKDVQVGCRELWAKRYISDGFCTSIKPLREVVCAGHCLPIRDLPWYAEFVELWTKAKMKEWQCVEAVVRKKSVNLLCRNGEYRTYRIKVVKACKCERTVQKRNRTERPGAKKSKRRKGRKGRKKGKKKKRRRGGGGGNGNRKQEAEVPSREKSVHQRQEEEEESGGQRQSVREAQRQSEGEVSSDSGVQSPGQQGQRDSDRSQGL